MSWRKTFFFLLAVAFLAGFYYFRARQEHFSKDPFSFSREAARTNVLTLADGERVGHLTIQDASRGSEIALFKAQKKNWHMVRPIRYPAESLIVDGLVSLLKLSPRARQLSFEGLGADEFGFDAPRLRICVSTDRSSKERCLLVGSDAVVAKGAYAKWEDESKYFLVSRDFLNAFDKTLYSLRKKQVFTLLDQEVMSIEFLSREEERFIKSDGKNWSLEKPLKAALGSEAMNRLLMRLNDLYVKEFLDNENARNPRLGFEPADKRIRVTFRDGSHEMLIQGREAKGKDAYYAKKGDQETVLLISLGKLNKVESAFRDLIS
ncbi:MAG: DUF4340 domain-containing protein [Candidatus Omnitrophica bacterium]|nr:DUF4340 domain-containing protein [Candidatus Omnitrophota bacterium]